MDSIINIIFEVVLRTLGLWVLKLLTFGRYRDTKSSIFFAKLRRTSSHNRSNRLDLFGDWNSGISAVNQLKAALV